MSITASNVTIESIKIKDYNFTSASTTSNAYGGGGIRVGAIPGTAEIDSSISGITITDVYFENNSTNAASGDGGAIAVIYQSGSNNTTVTVNGCTFDGNRSGTSGSYVAAMSGAAIIVKKGGILTVNNSLFFDNITDYRGAITLWTGSTGTINNSTFYDNKGYSSHSSAIYNYESTSLTVNNSILYNSYKSGSTLGYDINDYLGSSIDINYSLTRAYESLHKYICIII